MIKIYAEIASTPLDHAKGLMGRKYMDKNAGMLFDFGKNDYLTFWMKNTYIPLQIAFIDSCGKIGQIESMIPLSTRAVRSNGLYRYALEANEGWFDENNIRVGATVALPPDLNGQKTDKQSPQDGDQPNLSPEIQIERSFKDILRSVSDHPIKIVVRYRTKGSNKLVIKTIEPPFEFGKTADGDADGLLTFYDSQDPKTPWKSLIIDLIEGIYDFYDPERKPIRGFEDVNRIFKHIPMNKDDEKSVKGKMIPVVEGI